MLCFRCSCWSALPFSAYLFPWPLNTSSFLFTPESLNLGIMFSNEFWTTAFSDPCASSSSWPWLACLSLFHDLLSLWNLSDPLSISSLPCSIFSAFSILLTHACLVPQLWSALWDLMDYSPSGPSVHRIVQARILEWVQFPAPWDLHNPGIKSTFLESPALAGRFLTTMQPGNSIHIT